MHIAFPTVGVELCAYVLSHFSHVQLSATPWTVAQQAPLSMGFSRQEYLSELPFTSPGDLPDAGIDPMSLIGRWVLYTWEALGIGIDTRLLYKTDN